MDACVSVLVGGTGCWVFACVSDPSFCACACEGFEEVFACGSVLADVVFALFVCVADVVEVRIVLYNNACAVLLTRADVAGGLFD